MVRLIAVLLALSASNAFADNTIICQDEAQLIGDINQKNLRLAEQVNSLRTLNQGLMISSRELTLLVGKGAISSHKLNLLREHVAANEPDTELESIPLCEKSAQEFSRTVQTFKRLKQEYTKLIQQFLAIPDENLINLYELQIAHSNLEHAYEKFLERIQPLNASQQLLDASKQAVDQLNNQIAKLYMAFLVIEEPTIYTLTPHADVMSINLKLPIESKELEIAVEVFQDKLYLARIELTKIRINLHDLVWSKISIFSLLYIDEIKEIPNLLKREINLILWKIQQSILETSIRGKEESNIFYSSSKVVFFSILISGLAIIFIFTYAASKIEKIIFSARDYLSNKYKKGHIAKLIKTLNPIMPAIPWTILLIMILSLEDILINQNWTFFLWTIPFLKVILIMIIFTICMDWLFARIKEISGNRLNDEQHRNIKKRILRNACFVGIAWISAISIQQILGASLIFNIINILCIFITYWCIGAILSYARNDFIENTEQALAKDLSDDFKKWLQGYRFVFIAPILLPIQLAFFFVVESSTLFNDFDWYKRLSSRWFWLRTRYQAEHLELNTAPYKIDPDIQRWFSLYPPKDTEFPTIDTGVVGALRKHIDHWHADHLFENTLLVTGSTGIGKGFALNCLKESIKEEMPETRIIMHKVNTKIYKKEDIRNLIGNLLEINLSNGNQPLLDLDKKIPPTIIMLSKCQNLFLSKIGGLEAWKELIDITNFELDNIFWVFSINNQSWSYLENVFGRQYQLRNILKIKNWSQHDIRSLILSRTNLSGYKIKYDENLLTAYGHANQSTKSSEQRFFSLLWDSCKGTPMMALELFKTAIKSSDQELFIGLPTITNQTDLPEIGADLLFVYRAILIHDNLSINELIDITQQSEYIVRYALKTGTDAEFLIGNRQGRYRISPLWYYTILNLLSRKNMTHG